MAVHKNFFVVWKGRQPGVYDNIDDALEQVDDFPGALFKSYPSAEAAAEAYRKGCAGDDSRDLGNLVAGLNIHRLPKAGQPDYMTIPDIDLNGWAVDASCQGNPGTMEYQGVELMTGKVLFRVGPFRKSTNNIGEFLAIVHALALMQKKGESHTIYSDSVTGMSWVRNRKVKTQLTMTEENEDSFKMMQRALVWLNTNRYDCKILKWQTEFWGEIPADFGRK